MGGNKLGNLLYQIDCIRTKDEFIAFSKNMKGFTFAGFRGGKTAIFRALSNKAKEFGINIDEHRQVENKRVNE